MSQTEEAFIYISEEMPDSSLDQISCGFLQRVSGDFLLHPVLPAGDWGKPAPSPQPLPFSALPSLALLGSQGPPPAAIFITFLQLNCFLISAHGLLLLLLIKFSISFPVYFSWVSWLAWGKENMEVAELWGQARKPDDGSGGG